MNGTSIRGKNSQTLYWQWIFDNVESNNKIPVDFREICFSLWINSFTLMFCNVSTQFLNVFISFYFILANNLFYSDSTNLVKARRKLTLSTGFSVLHWKIRIVRNLLVFMAQNAIHTDGTIQTINSHSSHIKLLYFEATATEFHPPRSWDLFSSSTLLNSRGHNDFKGRALKPSV